jgi:hypothetical protein
LKGRFKFRYVARLVVLIIATYCGVGFLAGCFALYDHLKLDQAVNRFLDAEHVPHTHFSRYAQHALLMDLIFGGVFVACVIVYRRLARESEVGFTSKS